MNSVEVFGLVWCFLMEARGNTTFKKVASHGCCFRSVIQCRLTVVQWRISLCLKFMIFFN